MLSARYVALTEPAVKPRVRSHRDDNTSLQGPCHADASSANTMPPPPGPRAHLSVSGIAALRPFPLSPAPPHPSTCGIAV